jgi:hypothetical protein
MRILLGYFCLLLFITFARAQSRVGTWEDHVNLENCLSVCKFDGKIYACNYSSILVYDKEDGSVERLSKINGLSDVGIRQLILNPNNNRLLVIYDNSNLDIILPGNKILNYSDLFRKNFSGKKNINDALFVGKMAYLSCGFGIALFDTEKLEIKDTYIVGPNATNLEVYQLAMDDSVMYAATPLGLRKCNYKTKILNDYRNWVLADASLPSGTYGNVVNYNNTIFTTYSPYKQSNIQNQDTIYAFNGSNWARFLGIGHPYHIKKMKIAGNQLGFINQFGSLFLNSTYGINAYITQYNNFGAYPSDFVFEDGPRYWIADANYGLIYTGGSNPFFPPNFIKVNGMSKNFISNIDVFEGKIAVSPMRIETGGGATFAKAGINVYENGDWINLRNEGSPGDTISDFCSVMLDRKDKSRMWASSWISGLVEIVNNQIVKVYNGDNTGGAMQSIVPLWWRSSGMDMDEDGNLFFALSDVQRYLSVRKTNGTFQNFSFDGLARFVRRVKCDKFGQVWILHERDQGLTVAKFGKQGTNLLLTGYKVLNKNVGSGNLGSNSVYSIVEDRDGKIWVGTASGIRVFNTPNSILSGGSVDGEPIKILQDGNVELLLESEVVTSMDVDAANNKWVGTQAGGVYCFSPDGQRQLFHFTSDNSPLYTNEIIDIKCDGKTGNVLIGSTQGLQSYKNIIMEGSEDYSSIVAYPNPVKPNYTGNVYISGLIDESIVKIADQAGNFVWEVKAKGGRIEWPMKSFSGNRVSSGVYVVYTAIPNGEIKAVTKVLVIN